MQTLWSSAISVVQRFFQAQRCTNRLLIQPVSQHDTFAVLWNLWWVQCLKRMVGCWRVGQSQVRPSSTDVNSCNLPSLSLQGILVAKLRLARSPKPEWIPATKDSVLEICGYADLGDPKSAYKLLLLVLHKSEGEPLNLKMLCLWLKASSWDIRGTKKFTVIPPSSPIHFCFRHAIWKAADLLQASGKVARVIFRHATPGRWGFGCLSGCARRVPHAKLKASLAFTSLVFTLYIPAIL